MGFYDGAELPVYDHLAHNYCVCDHWFSSVPGATARRHWEPQGIGSVSLYDCRHTYASLMIAAGENAPRPYRPISATPRSRAPTTATDT